MTERHTRKKAKTTHSRAVEPASEDDTGLEWIKRDRKRQSGPRMSEIRAVSAQLRALLRTKDLDEPDQEAGIIGEARRLAAELTALLERQKPPDPLLELAVDGALDAIELRSLLPQHAELQKQVRAAKVAYRKRHEARDVVHALRIPTPKGPPTIDPHRALQRYLVILQQHRRLGPVHSKKGSENKSRALLAAQLSALARVCKEFGYKTDNAALAGLQVAKRGAKRKVKKNHEAGEIIPRDVRAGAEAFLPSRSAVRRRTDRSQ
jgi:hypothetical protein